MSKLTRKEIKDLVRLLKKVRLPAPYPVFVALCKSVPLIAVDLAIINDKNEILLTYRKDEFYDGWHIPGSILRSEEPVEKAFQRVASQELGLKINKAAFLRYFTQKDARQYGVTLLFVTRFNGRQKLKDGQFFLLNKLPKGFLKVQNPEIAILKRYLNLVYINKL